MPLRKSTLAALLECAIAAAAAAAVLGAAAPAAIAADAAASPPHAARVFVLDPAALAAVKARLAANDPVLQPAREQLLADADRALEMQPVSVMDKTLVPPSGDRHDYISLAPYWWPDPTKRDGLPYIRRDGEHNPESSDTKRSDSPRFGRTAAAIRTLSLAYYLTGSDAYARKAALLLRTWFLDPATRMNPNLKYGQAVRGRNDGRGTGIIETAERLPDILDSVGVLAGSSAWTAQDQSGMVAWARAYLDWLQTSPNGRDEAKAQNNHGTFYDMQAVSLALFTGQDDLARRILEAAKQKRIAVQVEPDGRLPRELARTKSFHYTLFDLDAMERLANMGERAGVNLWDYTTPDGRSIRKAIDYLLPYADPGKRWSYKEIAGVDRPALFPVFQEAYIHYHAPAYRDAIARLPADRIRSSMAWLLYPGDDGAAAPSAAGK